MENTVKWGIIGCGDVTEVKSGPAFRKVENSELVAVMRRNADLAADYAKRHNVKKWYSSANDLINDPDINAIYIATPPDSHAKYTIQALEAGKPVYVEKPMALNYKECVDMVRASQRHRVPLYVAYYRRALPGFVKIKELIESGAIGNIRFVNLQLYKNFTIENKEIPWRVEPKKAGGGLFFDLASHQLDLLDFFLGPIKRVNSLVKNQSGNYEAEDLVTANFEFDNNVLGSGVWSFSSNKISDKDNILIVGDKGEIECSTFGFTPTIIRLNDETHEFSFDKPKHVEQNLIELVVKDILGKASSPSTGLSAARTSMVMDLVVKEYYKNKSKT